jgi:hypothetical protein
MHIVQAHNEKGDRIPLASVESTDVLDHRGVPYYVYEVSQRGSPNIFDPRKDTFRRGLCVTGVRRGQGGSPFLFTLALSCPSVAWDDLRRGYQEAVESFELTPPGKKYVPPDKDPWNIF